MKVRINEVKIGKRFRQDLGDLKGLAEEIKEVGQIVPIVIDKNKELIDGARRIEVMKSLGIEAIEAIEFNPEDRVRAEVGANYTKEWNPIEAVSIWDAMESFPGGRGKTLSDSDRVYRQQRAAKLTGYSHDSLSKAKQVIKDGGVELLQLLQKGKVNEAYRKMKIEEQKEQVEKLIPEQKIKGVFDVIVIDPPWDYGIPYDSEGHRGTAPYPVMGIEEIKAVEIPAAENCVLWLWTTNAFMNDAYDLLDEWGFEPKTILTWDKQIMGVGRWLRNITEHCILAIKGKPFFNNTKWTTLISEKRTGHSNKPEIFYKMVEEICEGRKLDYFATKKRKGWEVYGNIR